jgi:hypothetical protein
MFDIESDQSFSDDEDVISPVALTSEQIANELDNQYSKSGESKRRTFYWDIEETFESYQEALQFIKDKWTYQKTHDTKTGDKKYYKCAITRSCKARIHLHILDDSQTVNLYRDSQDHAHHIISLENKRLRKEIKDKILELYALKVTQPLNIIYSLRKQGLVNLPTPKQITNFLARTKKKLNGQASINYKQFSEFCLSHTNTPQSSDLNKAFIVNFEVDACQNKNQRIRMVVSTRYLLELASRNRFGCVDATYKLVYQGHPIILAGHVDKRRHFHPTCLAITTGENNEDFSFILRSVQVK